MIEPVLRAEPIPSRSEEAESTQSVVATMSLRRPEVTNDRRTSDEFGAVDGRIEPRLSFGPFILDPETGRLFEGEHVVPLAPKPFETLHYLADRPGRVVSKPDLMERSGQGLL